jgi:hypothetical protein
MSLKPDRSGHMVARQTARLHGLARATSQLLEHSCKHSQTLDCSMMEHGADVMEQVCMMERLTLLLNFFCKSDSGTQTEPLSADDVDSTDCLHP